MDKAIGRSCNQFPVLTDNSVCFGVHDGFFYCLDRENGRQLWEFSPGQRDLDPATCDGCALLFNTPIIENDVIYLSSYDNNVYALDAQRVTLIGFFPQAAPLWMLLRSLMKSSVLEVTTGMSICWMRRRESKCGVILCQNLRMDSGYYTGVLSTPRVDASTIYAAYGPIRAIDIQSGRSKVEVFDSTKYKDQITGSPFFLKT